ncbi:MAG: hypothetical protein RJB31_1864, partial [Bacteroidota bacterium]
NVKLSDQKFIVSCILACKLFEIIPFGTTTKRENPLNSEGFLVWHTNKA